MMNRQQIINQVVAEFSDSDLTEAEEINAFANDTELKWEATIYSPSNSWQTLALDTPPTREEIAAAVHAWREQIGRRFDQEDSE
ncbi:MAG: hypothetical protein KGL39_05770 [Patescibacteria group bacterium]|nr:hypothetical protein [Patescibacteria group bacterium]